MFKAHNCAISACLDIDSAATANTCPYGQVGTEVTLLVTLTFSTMLRFDLSNGAGPCTDAVVPRSCSRAHPPHEHYPDLGFGGVLRLRKGSRAEDIGEDFIGRMLVLSNCAIPGASLAVGIVRFGLKFEREMLPVGPNPCAQHSNSAVDSRSCGAKCRTWI